MGASPRTLADDLLATAQGPHSADLIEHVMHMTYAFITDMGGTPARHKTLLFATTAEHRLKLQQSAFAEFGLENVLVHDFRDLGAHLDTTKRGRATTLTGRLQRATRATTVM